MDNAFSLFLIIGEFLFQALVVGVLGLLLMALAISVVSVSAVLFTPIIAIALKIKGAIKK